MYPEEKYTLVLSGEEAEWLDSLVSALPYVGAWARAFAVTSSKEPMVCAIKRKLHYKPPMFKVGTLVQRVWGDGSLIEDQVYEISHHSWVSPRNWTAWLQLPGETDSARRFGTGERYLKEVKP